jgi:hypothetical protein
MAKPELDSATITTPHSKVIATANLRVTVIPASARAIDSPTNDFLGLIAADKNAAGAMKKSPSTTIRSSSVVSKPVRPHWRLTAK